ncbi:MAG: cyclic nucleotide-binding domain-containing protein, partial [Spirochaetota bacterium]
MMEENLQHEFLQELHIKHYGENEVIFEEGDLADETMFFLFKGRVGIYREIQGKRIEIRKVGPGEFFGEIGLVNKQPRIATVMALDTDVKVGLFNRDSFFLLAKSSPEFLFNMFRSAIVKLSQANLQFIQLTESASLSDEEEREIDSRYIIKQYNIRNYVNDVATKNYMKNDIVFLESDVSDGAMYFVFEGEFLVSHKDKEGVDRHITTLKYGDFFGEMALLNSKPRSATIKATSLNTKVAKLDKGVF